MKMMSEREQLMQLISRTMPTVPSLMADAILKSTWLKDHDENIFAELVTVYADGQDFLERAIPHE